MTSKSPVPRSKNLSRISHQAAVALTGAAVAAIGASVPAALAGSGWTEYAAVAELVATDKHYYEVRLPVTENASGCKKAHWFYQDYASRGADEMFTALLEALKSRLNVRVYVTGVCNLNGYSEISSVSVVR